MTPATATGGTINLHHMAQAIVTVLAVINPVVCGSIFLNLTAKMERSRQPRSAAKVAVAILVILVASALVGRDVLRVFGISLDVFQAVGGTIISYMGLDMLAGRHSVGRRDPDGDGGTGDLLAPLLMFAAGPGTIAAVVTLSAAHAADGLPSTALVAAVIGAAVTFAALLAAIRAGARLGHGAQAGITRFMGLIVASMGMQFILVGLKAFMQSPTG
jgi:multiple antibiotic resistance protein